MWYKVVYMEIFVFQSGDCYYFMFFGSIFMKIINFNDRFNQNFLSLEVFYFGEYQSVIINYYDKEEVI